MKKVRMNISHSRFILSKLKIFGEIVTTFFFSMVLLHKNPILILHSTVPVPTFPLKIFQH